MCRMPMTHEMEGPSSGRGWGGAFDRVQSVSEIAMDLWISTFNAVINNVPSSTTAAINAANQAVAAFKETFKKENK